MTINEVLEALTPENARFVSGQDLFLYVPKAQTNKRYGLVKYSPNDFSINSDGVLTLLLPKSQIEDYFTEVYGGTRNETVLADPAINLLNLDKTDKDLYTNITRLDGRINSEKSRVDSLNLEIYGASGREGTVLNDINLTTLNATDLELKNKDIELQKNIDDIIQDDRPSSALNSTYSSSKITQLIKDAKMEGLHFVGFIGSEVGKDYNGESLIKEGALWHVSNETTSPTITNEWSADTMYKCVGGEWVKTTAYTPQDFDIWKNVNIPDSQINSWWYFEGTFEVLDFTVDMNLYYTKVESDARYYTKTDADGRYYTKSVSDERFKSNFSYGNYLSETNSVLNIDTDTLPTKGSLTSFVKGQSDLDVDNVESAIKLLETNVNAKFFVVDNRSRIIDKSIEPIRANDYAVDENGVYISQESTETPGKFEWVFKTKDLTTLLPRSNANRYIVKGINFTNDSSTGYLSSSLSTINLNTEEENSASFEIPVATNASDGIMPATAMRAISELDIRVTALQSGVQSYFVDFGSDNPSQEALTLLYQDMSGKTDTPPNLTRLIDASRNSYYEYYISLEVHWQGPYVYRYSVASLSQIGLVGSSEQKGEIYVEPVTGVMSLNGYNDIISTFNTLYGGTDRTAINVSQVPSLPTSKITSGTLDVARLPIIPISKGGTNNDTFSAYKLVVTGNVDSTTSTPASLVDGPSFGALNTVLVGQGANQLPIFKSREDAGLELVSRKITAWGTPTDVQYPSAKLVHDSLNDLQNDPAIIFAESERQKSKNLLNATTSETTFGNMTFSADTSSIYFNGSYTDADRCMFNSWALKKGTYTLNIEYISGSITRFENILFYLYKGGSWTQYSEAINLSSSNKAGSVSFTLDEDVNDARLALYQNLTNTMTNCVFKYQIVEGTNSDFDFQPYNGAIVHEKEFHETLQNTPAIVFAESERQKSKNLFNINNTVLDYSLNLGEFGQQLNMASTKAESYGRCCTNINNLIKVKPNTQYVITNNSTFKCSVGQINASRLVITETGWKTDSTLTITTTSATEYIAFNFGKTDNSKITSSEFSNFLLSHIQIEEGSVATDYQPYHGQISHSGDKEIEFARNEYEKSKNLFGILKTYSITYNNITITINSDTQKVLINGTASSAATISFSSDEIVPISVKNGEHFTISKTPNVAINVGINNKENPSGSIIYVNNTEKVNTNTITQDDKANRLYFWYDTGDTFNNVEFGIQVEKGSVATDYQPYYGQITRSGDKEIEFARNEYEKSKNLIPYPYYDGNSIVSNGITFTVNNDQSISVSGSIIDHNSNAVMWLAWDMPLKAGTYRISDSNSSNDLSVVAWIGNDYYQKDVNNGMFTLASDTTARIYLQVAKGSTKTYNDTIRFMLCEGTDTDWQPYNGEIIHEKKLNEIVNGKYPIDINACTTYDQVYNLLQNATCGKCGIGVEHTSAIKSLLPTFPTNAGYVDCVANVIKNKYTASANLYAIRFTGCPFGVNQPIYYCDVFYDGQNTIVTGWYKPEAIELIYDRDTKNTIGGTEYASGIKSGTIINHDFSQYKKLILTVYRDNVGSFDYEINLEYLDYSGVYCGSGITYSFQPQDNYFVYSSAKISADKQQMVYIKSGYTETFFETMVSKNDVPILRIKGIK